MWDEVEVGVESGRRVMFERRTSEVPVNFRM